MSTEPIRYAIRWRRPDLTTYRTDGPRTFAARLYRYPGVVTGCAVRVGRRVLSLKWGTPRQVSGCPDCAKRAFHDRHTTVAQRRAEMDALAAELRAAGPVRSASTEGEETR